MQNVTGFMVGRQAEAAGIAKAGAKLVMAVANAKASVNSTPDVDTPTEGP